MKLEKGQVGFGINESDARQDLLFNLCKQNIMEDKSGRFIKRRKELHPWLPKRNMLHLTGVGCLLYDRYSLTNTVTHKTIPVHCYDKTIYYYLAELFGEFLTYTDIAIVLQPELNEFFKNISCRFIELNQYPYIEVTDRSSGFSPNTVYTIQNDIIVATSTTTLGVKLYGSDYYYVVPYESDMDIMSMISYVGYRIGAVISKSEVKICGEED